MATIATMTSRLRSAIGGGHKTALAAWRAAVRAAVVDNVEPDAADLERIARDLGINSDDVADTFAADAGVWDLVARLEVGHASSVRELAVLTKRHGNAATLNERAATLRREADELERHAGILEGIASAGRLELSQARIARMRCPRLFDNADASEAA